MRIIDRFVREELAKVLSDQNARRIVAATLLEAKSANELSKMLIMPTRTLYRYVDTLCRLGILARERIVVMEGGGKYALYRSMVKSATVSYQGDELDVDLTPNEKILERFLRFWSYMRG